MPDIEFTLGLARADVEIAPMRGSEMSEDATLVKAISSGDEDAFNHFHRKYAPLVHGIVLAKLPADEADDVMQEIFLAAFRGIKGLRDPDAVGPWLVRLTRNHVAGFYRSRRVSEELPDEIHDRHSDRHEAAEILLAIRSLPEAYSETLVLRLIEGMTGDEIATRTGLTSGSVRVNLHRGMDLLRKALGVEVNK